VSGLKFQVGKRDLKVEPSEPWDLTGVVMRRTILVAFVLSLCIPLFAATWLAAQKPAAEPPGDAILHGILARGQPELRDS
jgi:hypothetical protein